MDAGPIPLTSTPRKPLSQSENDSSQSSQQNQYVRNFRKRKGLTEYRRKRKAAKLAQESRQSSFNNRNFDLISDISASESEAENTTEPVVDCVENFEKNNAYQTAVKVETQVGDGDESTETGTVQHQAVRIETQINLPSSMGDEMESSETGTVRHQTVKVETHVTRLPDLLSCEDEEVRKKVRQIRSFNLIIPLVKALNEADDDMFDDFIVLMSVLGKRLLPAKNIAFLTCLDRALLANCKNTTQMRYKRQDTIDYWTVVDKQSDGKVMRLLSGPKDTGTVKTGANKKSQYDPSLSKANFAIPTRRLLGKYVKHIDKEIPPGFIESILSTVPRDREFVLCFDGKYISDGLREYGKGDIHLWGLEGPPNLEMNEKRYQRALKLVDDIDLSHNLDKLPILLSTMSFRIKDMRILVASFQKLKMKLDKASKTQQKQNRYAYALSTIRTNIITAQAVISNILDLNKKICSVMSDLQDSRNVFISGDKCVLGEQLNYHQLLTPDELKHHYDLDQRPELCKQGTEEWKALRMKSRITGSSLFRGLGFDTIPPMKRHFAEFMENGPGPEFTDEELANMKYGRENEINGVATAAGVLVPALLPTCFRVKEIGALFLDGQQVENLLEVSPDAFIKCSDPKCTNASIFDNHKNIALEVKCPVEKPKGIVRQHYEVPFRYLLQLQAEMKALQTDIAWYVCYTPESTTLIEVKFNRDMWSRMCIIIEEVYGLPLAKCPTNLPPMTKAMKEDLQYYRDETCCLLAEVKSVFGFNGEFVKNAAISPHTLCPKYPTSDIDMQEILDEISRIAVNARIFLGECFQLQRKKATEMVTFVLTDTDRMSHEGVALNFPIAYALKGYSMTTDILRKMRNMVRDRLRKEGIRVLCESYDGQWQGVVVRDDRGYPLTRLQVAKDTWKEVQKMSKDELLSVLNKMSTSSGWSWKDYAKKAKNKSFSALRSSYNGQVMTFGRKRFNNIEIEFVADSRPIQDQPTHCRLPVLPRRGERVMYVQSYGGKDFDIRGHLNELGIYSKDQNPKLWSFQIKERKGAYSVVKEHETIIDFLPQQFIAEAREAHVNQLLHETDEEAIIFDENEGDNVLYDEARIRDEARMATVVQGVHTNVMQPQLDMNVSIADSTAISLDTSILDESFRGRRRRTRVPVVLNEYTSRETKAEIKQVFESVGMDFVDSALARLQTFRNKKGEPNVVVQNMDSIDLLRLMSDSNALFDTLQIAELKILEKELQLLTGRKFFNSKMTKPVMVTIIGTLFGSFTVFNVKRVKMDSLKNLCTKEIKKSLYPKKVLAAAYGRALNVERIQEWETSAPIPMTLLIRDLNYKLILYGFPQYSASREQVEPAMLDATHLFTNVRSSATGRGLPTLGVSKQAWLDVCAYDSDILSLGYITDIVEKQSAAVAAKIFSEEVEEAMRFLGHHDSAKFVKHIRHFYEACDKRHVPIDTRIRYLVELHVYLTDGIDMHAMPAPGTHIHGLSVTTYEGLLMNVTIRIILYSLAKNGTYNPRAPTTLSVESIYSDFASLVYSLTGNVQSVMVPKLWGDMAVINYFKHLPGKSFYLQTVAHPTYPAAEADCTNLQGCFVPTKHGYQFKPHMFDAPPVEDAAQKRARDTKITKTLQPLRGGQPLRVRGGYRKNETTIPMHIRRGFTDEQLKNLES